MLNVQGCETNRRQDRFYGAFRALLGRRMMWLAACILNSGTGWGVSSQLKGASTFSQKTGAVCTSNWFVPMSRVTRVIHHQ
jgi:hypothetical protein